MEVHEVHKATQKALNKSVPILLIIDILGKVVSHVKTNFVIRRAADHARRAAHSHSSELARRPRDPRSADCHAERAMGIVSQPLSPGAPIHLTIRADGR